MPNAAVSTVFMSIVGMVDLAPTLTRLGEPVSMLLLFDEEEGFDAQGFLGREEQLVRQFLFANSAPFVPASVKN